MLLSNLFPPFSTFRKGGAKTTFRKSCAKPLGFWFYLFLKGKVAPNSRFLVLPFSKR
jgi:hypothetical protein